jgi:tRNA 2-thiouridine synthesizing protein A
MTDPVTITRTLDTKGMLCPKPVIETSKAIKQLATGQILEVLATDPASNPDLEAWAKMTGNKLLSSEELGGTPPTFRFTIQRMR